eukprot:TRINITY_DN26476_c0_g1_i1.p1 TRINITY_DN26476_c0_g1~~TRINITY_DN26476_c0_g1_i1.p1  ORF type:complete len:491 (+),score=111.39 TRINITY_DN26476_c0_g1_i1:143-1615(+)
MNGFRPEERGLPPRLEAGVAAGSNGAADLAAGRRWQEVGGEDEDALSKARLAAQAHLQALREHMDQGAQAYQRLESIVFMTAEGVKSDRQKLNEEKRVFAAERQQLEAEREALRREREELRQAREQFEQEQRNLQQQQQVQQRAPVGDVIQSTPPVPKTSAPVLQGTNSWAPPQASVSSATTVQLGAGSSSALSLPRRILVFGGFDGTADHRSTEVLDLSSMTFSLGPTMGVGRSGCAVASLDERRVLVAGGFDGSRSLDTTELVDPLTLKVVPGPCMGTRRNACAAVRIDEHRLLVIGGSDDASELDSTELLDLETMTFAPGPQMGTRRNACAASLLDGRRLLVIGGSDGCSDLDSTEMLDLNTMTFSPGPRMGTRRNFCATSLLRPSAVTAPGAGLLLVLGGSDGSSSLNSTEVLDVSQLTFMPGPHMGTWRSGCAAAVLGPEQLLVVGGFDGSNHLETTEVLDVSCMSFSSGPRLGTWRSGCAAAPC